MFKWFTVRAREVNIFAWEEAKKNQHRYFDNERLRLGVFFKDAGGMAIGVAIAVMQRLGVDLIKFWSSLLGTYEFRGYKIPVYLMGLTGGGVDTFDAISDAHMASLKRHVGLSSGQVVVEIGCGIGRDAIPLIDILGPEGKYLGVDIIKPSIDWCNQNIAARKKNFSFAHLDIKDQFYNSAGTLKASEIIFPVEDGTVDRIILQSVFTHMLPLDIKHYLKEFKRILKKDGLCYATVFLYNEEVLKSARKTKLSFGYELTEGVRLNDPANPTYAVAYTESFIKTLLFETGIEMVRDPLKGAWSGYYASDPNEGQDALILKCMNSD